MSALGEVVSRLGLKRSGRAWRGDCPPCGYQGGFVRSVTRDGKRFVAIVSEQDSSPPLVLVQNWTTKLKQ